VTQKVCDGFRALEINGREPPADPWNHLCRSREHVGVETLFLERTSIGLVIRATAAEPLALAGIEAALAFTGRRLDDVAAAFGLALPPLPELRAAGEITGGNGDWAVKALTVRLGRSDVEGGIALSTRGLVPYARADLSSSLIDLDDFAGLATAARATASVPPAAWALPQVRR